MRTVNLKRIGYVDVMGGGQVNVRDGTCFVGHINPPEGTTLIDVKDPASPRVLSTVKVPLHMHSHKVRSKDGLMMVNSEAFPEFNVTPELEPGLRLFDISDRERPRQISLFRTGGRGVHRFEFDGTYAFLSTEMEGYQGNIIVIVDLTDPLKPHEVGRWWMEGQWAAGGESPSEEGVLHRVHHPVREGDRLYVGCCHAGMAIVDISDLSAPKTISRHPLHGLFSHTVLPVEDKNGSPYVIAVDEGWWDMAGAFSVVDIADLSAPRLVKTVEMPEGKERGIWQPHQPHEEIIEGFAFVAWFSHGLVVVDVSDPANAQRVAHHLPAMRSEFGPLSNDVFVDKANRRVYLLDRVRGLEILEYDVR